MNQGTPMAQMASLSDAEKRVLANQQALGRDFVTQLYVCLKTASFYDISNENFKKQLTKLADFLDIVFESKKKITVTSVEGYLFFNEQRLKINLDGYLAAKYIQQQFDKLKVSGVAFKKPVSTDELTAVILAVTGSSHGENGADGLNEALAAKRSKISHRQAFWFWCFADDSRRNRKREISSTGRSAFNKFFTWQRRLDCRTSPCLRWKSNCNRCQ